MLLRSLNEYADRLKLPPRMYGPMSIRWIIHLDQDGRFQQIVETAAEGRKGKRGKEYVAPHIGRSVDIRAKLLADNGEYVLGVPRDPDDEKAVEKVKARHRAFVELTRECAKATREPSVHAVLRFLENLPEGLTLPEGFDPSDNLTFDVAGVWPIDLPSVQAFWAQYAGGTDEEGGASTTGPVMTCLVCGRQGPAVVRLPFKLKGIPGGQSSGVALVSANAKAFESYGLEASLISPMCHDCAERTHKAANTLLAEPKTHLTVGPVVYVAWTREPVESDFLSILSQPNPSEVRKLLTSVYHGKSAAIDIDDSRFYAVAMSASGGRAVVRDWLDTTVGTVRRNLARFFALQRVSSPDGQEVPPLSIFALAAGAVRDPSRDLPPELPHVLVRMALAGTPLPTWVLIQVVKRCRAEQRVTRQQASLLRLTLLSGKPEAREDELMALDRTNPAIDPAYVCGRLLAVLEEIQRAAVPGAKATLVDRFYGAASTSPATVFGALFRTAQSHLGKLRKERPGAYIALQQRLAEVQQHLTAFPRTLRLEQQALFALGYYHQRAADWAAARARSEVGEAEELPGDNQE